MVIAMKRRRLVISTKRGAGYFWGSEKLRAYVIRPSGNKVRIDGKHMRWFVPGGEKRVFGLTKKQMLDLQVCSKC